MRNTAEPLVVDIYAGPGGWDEGMLALGITNVVGIEWDWAACKTAAAADHTRVQADVTTVPPGRFRGARVVGSPPCTPFSRSGKRLGEVDRRRVHELVDKYAAGADDPGTGWADPRSHHTAQPVRWIREVQPPWACLEQVPEVLPLWRHIGRVLERWGYSVWTGVLNAANYGVPQTRERAVLIATRLGLATSPPPTHTEQPGMDLFGEELMPWVTIGQALGWEGVDRPARSICGHRAPRWAYGPAASYGTGWTLTNSQSNSTARHANEPAGTVFCSRAGNLRWQRGDQVMRVGVTEAAILQGFRADYPWHGGKGKQYEQVSNAVPPLLAAAVVAQAAGLQLSATRPYPTGGEG